MWKTPWINVTIRTFLFLSCTIFLLLSGYSQKPKLSLYQYGDGFTSTQIDQNTFEVSVQSPQGMIGDMKPYLLCLLSDLTLAQDGKYFSFLTMDRNKDTRLDMVKVTGNVAGTIKQSVRTGYVDYSQLRVSRYNSQTSRYGASGIVQVFAERPTSGEYYDAELIQRKMVPRMKKGMKRGGKISFWRRVGDLFFFFRDLMKD